MTSTSPTIALCVCGNPNCDIPYGYCHCRCNKKVNTSKKNRPEVGVLKGQPFPFLRGHNRSQRPIKEDAAPFKIDGVYCRLIPLTHGMYAIVNAEDYEWLIFWRWQAYKYKKTWYAVRREMINGVSRTFYMHREVNKGDPSKMTDHKSGIGLDNRRDNLRDADYSQNLMNRMKKEGCRCSSKGVSIHKGKFRSRIKVNGVEIHLGSFTIEEDAAKAYEIAAMKYFGKFYRPK